MSPFLSHDLAVIVCLLAPLTHNKVIYWSFSNKKKQANKLVNYVIALFMRSLPLQAKDADVKRSQAPSGPYRPSTSLPFHKKNGREAEVKSLKAACSPCKRCYVLISHHSNLSYQCFVFKVLKSCSSPPALARCPLQPPFSLTGAKVEGQDAC